MFHKIVILVFVMVFTFVGCQQPDNSATKQQKTIAQKTNKSEEGRTRPPEKKPALSVEEISVFFPEVKGYTREGAPKGNTADFSKFSVTQAEQVYQAKNGETVKITLFDYNDAVPLQSSAKAAIEKAALIENDRQLTKGVDLGIKGVSAMIVVQKADNSAHLTVSAGDRFLVTIQGTGEATVTEIGKNMSYEAMLK